MHRRRRGGPYGYGWGGIYSNVLPSPYAIVSDSDCACKSGGSGAVAGVEGWVRDNPILALIGVFALGMLVSKKKGLL